MCYDDVTCRCFYWYTYNTIYSYRRNIVRYLQTHRSTTKYKLILQAINTNINI